MRRSLICLGAVLAIGACRAEGGRGARNADGQPQAMSPRRDVLGALPKLPQATLRDTLGTPEAQSQKYATLAGADSVLGFFRHAFDSLGYRIESDQAQPAQSTVYATRDSSAVWLRVWSEPPVTMYTLIGTTIRAGERADTVAIRKRS